MHVSEAKEKINLFTNKEYKKKKVEEDDESAANLGLNFLNASI